MNKSLIQRLSLIFSDGIALIISLIIAVYFLNIVRPGSQEYINLNKLGLAKMLGFTILAVFWHLELYTKRRPIWEEIKLLYTTILVFAVIHFIITFLFSHHIVKLVNIVFWCFLLFILPLFRYLIKKILLKYNLWQRRVYIVGVGNNARITYQLLKDNLILGYKIVGFIDVINHISTLDIKINDIQVYPYQMLLDSTKKSDIEIIFALEPNELTTNINKVDVLQTKFTFVSVVPDAMGLPLYGATMDHFFGSNQIILRLKNNLSRRVNRIVKRASDIILSIIGICVLFPFFIIFAILIKLTGSKVFFKHKRIGRNGAYFYCLKFQTMYENSQEILEHLLATDEVLKAEWEKDFKLKNDPRVTKIGNFLRKTSLDEIPQLFNVLKGEMSLVGPRPIVDKEVQKYNEDFYYYELVRPGVTGLWQISGRNDVDYANRVSLDVWYVKNWSLWYDFVIILKTVIIVLARKGAY